MLIYARKLFSHSLLIFLFVSWGFTQNQENIGDSYKRQIALTTLEANLEEVRQIKKFEERIEVTGELVKVLEKESPDRCLDTLKLLFEDFLRFDEEDYKGQVSFIEFQEKTVGELIQLVSRFNKELTQIYLDKYLSKLKKHLNENDSGVDYPKLSRIYLNIASRLLEDDKNYAIAFAEKSLKYEVNLGTLEFLLQLYREDSSLADDLGKKAIQAVSKRNLKDVNESFVLHSYIFSASNVPAITSGKPIYFPTSFTSISKKPISNALIELFLRTSVNHLRDGQSRNYSNSSQVIHGAVGDFFLLNIIKIKAQKYAPNLLNKIENREATLSNFLNQQNHTNIKTFAKKNNVLKSYSKESLLKQAESARTPKAKDYFLYKAALIFLKEKQFDETLKIANRLSKNADETTKPYLKYRVARKLIEENEIEKALEIAKKDKDIQRKASIKIFSAEKIIKDTTKTFEATQLLNEAEALADKKTADKELLLIGISKIYSHFDMARATELWQKAIVTINKKQNFLGKSKLLKNFDEGNGFFTFYELLDSDLRYTSLLKQMSVDSFTETLQANQGIELINFKIRSNLALCRKLVLN